MNNLSPELNAAIRALSGESDLDVVRPAIVDWFLAHIIALAPGAHPIVRAVAALSGELPDLLDARIVADPALHNAIAHLIGTDADNHILSSWTKVAPADWGRTHAAKLIDAVQKRKCHSGVAAALLGPCETSAHLLQYLYDIPFAIRCWGQLTPDAPTAWMHALSVKERDLLLNTVHRVPSAAAMCLPWLPPDMANQTQIGDSDLASVFDAFIAASPTARTQHASIVQRLVAQAQPIHLDKLTRLACAMQSRTVWKRIQTLINRDPGAAYRVVAAAPWNALAKTVRTAILEHANQSDICAAIAAARGRKHAEHITHCSAYSAAAFFAALDPKVWDALSSAEQRRWRDALWRDHAHLAVRSLGLRPEFLARAPMSNDLERAALRCAPSANALHWALLPVTLRHLPPDAVIPLLTEMPTPPPDPGAFSCILCERSDPDVIARARAGLRTRNDLVISVVMQRYAHEGKAIQACCTALHHTLHGRSWKDIGSIMSLLDNDVHDALMPDADALVERLAHPDRRDALRHALARLETLSPEVSVPTTIALMQSSKNMSDAGKAIADALRDHGDLFLMVMDALTDDLRTVLFPLPEDSAKADALRNLAHDEPPTAQRLAYALHNGNWRDASHIVLLLPAQERDALTPTADGLVARLAHPDRQDALRHALDRLASFPPDVNLLVRFALDMGTNRNLIVAARDIAHALRGHGDVFLTMVDEIADAGLRTMLLPAQQHGAQADALRALAHDDPPNAHRLAHALRSRDRRDAIRVLLDVSPYHAENVWQALNDVDRREIVARVATGWSDDNPIVSRYPIIALALAAIQSDDLDLHHSGIAALEARTDILRVIWNELPQTTQQSLLTHPSLASAIADLPQTHDSARQRFRCR